MSEPKLIIEYRDRLTSKTELLNVEIRDGYEIYSYFGGDGPLLYLIDGALYEMQAGDVLMTPSEKGIFGICMYCENRI